MKPQFYTLRERFAVQKGTVLPDAMGGYRYQFEDASHKIWGTLQKITQPKDGRALFTLGMSWRGEGKGNTLYALITRVSNKFTHPTRFCTKRRIFETWEDLTIELGPSFIKYIIWEVKEEA